MGKVKQEEPLHADEIAALERIKREGKIVVGIDSGALRLLMVHLKLRGLVAATANNGKTTYTLA